MAKTHEHVRKVMMLAFKERKHAYCACGRDLETIGQQVRGTCPKCVLLRPAPVAGKWRDRFHERIA